MSIGMEEKEKVWLGLIETEIQNSNWEKLLGFRNMQKKLEKGIFEK